jgi:hypothetical protein
MDAGVGIKPGQSANYNDPVSQHIPGGWIGWEGLTSGRGLLTAHRFCAPVQRGGFPANDYDPYLALTSELPRSTPLTFFFQDVAARPSRRVELFF